MIRINLLAVERGPATRAAIIPAAHRVTLAASLILLGTALAVGWWFWSLRQTSIQLDRDIAQAEVETQQLRSVLSQVQKFEARKAQLQQRVTLIEQLRRGQTGPVHMLDEISRALPDRLWLTEITQKGDVVSIQGRTITLPALSDFVANLQNSPYFQRPVEIVSSSVETDAQGELVRFVVRAIFVPGGNARTPAAAAPAAPPPAGQGRD